MLLQVNLVLLTPSSMEGTDKPEIIKTNRSDEQLL